MADLKRYPIFRFQHAHFLWLAPLLGVALPTAIAGWGWGDWWGGFLFAGISKVRRGAGGRGVDWLSTADPTWRASPSAPPRLRASPSQAVLLNHSTFCINSLAHWAGDHTFSDQRTPRDCWWVSLLTFGEGQCVYVCAGGGGVTRAKVEYS